MAAKILLTQGKPVHVLFLADGTVPHAKPIRQHDGQPKLSYRYQNSSGKVFEDRRSDLLVHLFNHHTHHRGQAHTILSIRGRQPPPLDLIAMKRGAGAPDLRALAPRLAA